MGTNANKINAAENIINGFGGRNVKVVKKDNGLLERKNIEDKVILVEDNREVLFG